MASTENGLTGQLQLSPRPPKLACMEIRFEIGRSGLGGKDED